MTSKMTKEDRRREWAKLAVKASEQTGEPLPQEFYERTGIRPPKSNSFRAYVNRECPIVCVWGLGLQVIRESVGVSHG